MKNPLIEELANMMRPTWQQYVRAYAKLAFYILCTIALIKYIF